MRKKAVFMALAMTGLFAGTAMATGDQPAQPAQPDQVSADQQIQAADGSMQVAVFDKTTGKLRAPTPNEAAAFARKIEAHRKANATQPSTSGRPRNEAESLKTLRRVKVNGVNLRLVDTPESEMINVVGKPDAHGQIVAVHPGDNVQHAAPAEVTQ